jgi:Tol biopolymer transport system component
VSRYLVEIFDKSIAPAHGLDPETPAAAIRWGSTPRQRVLIGTAATLAADVERGQLRPPVTVVIGEVVRLRATLAWFERRPLFGKRALVTRTREQAATLAALLGEAGAEVIECPAIRIAPPESLAPLDDALARLETYDWLVLTSVNGVDQVFTKSIESPDAAQLTHSMTRCETPFWSPEGSFVYYRSSNGLWSLPATGGTPELVLPNVQAATMHRDGKTVVFIRDGKLWIDALRASHPREFGASPFPNSDLQLVRFSPDGSKVIAAVGNDGWILSYPTGAARKLPLPTHASFESANWFPDSRHMLASQLSTAITGTTLFIIDTQDASFEPFYQTTGWISEGSVSPDGKRIAYQTGQVEWNVLEISLATRAVRTMMGGSGVISWWPDWAPGGTHYLVSTNRSGASSIEDVSVAEGFSRRLVIPEPGEAAISARWAPDASRIAYSSASSTGNVLMLANTSGGRRTPVGVSLEGEPMFSWSPDGQRAPEFGDPVRQLAHDIGGGPRRGRDPDVRWGERSALP